MEKDKIEITAAMIEAAAEALRPYLSPQESVSQIRRMAEAALFAALGPQQTHS
ncbi:MAG: hypothetical protein FD144_5833 [Rhodospirillaceae bacterium]|nr:MAG: hypothetical protein FD144_5833 [Rhodospirillaceae bacterium]